MINLACCLLIRIRARRTFECSRFGFDHDSRAMNVSCERILNLLRPRLSVDRIFMTCSLTGADRLLPEDQEDLVRAGAALPRPTLRAGEHLVGYLLPVAAGALASYPPAVRFQE